MPPKRRATELPDRVEEGSDPAAYKYRAFLGASKRFSSHHKSINLHRLSNFNFLSAKTGTLGTIDPESALQTAVKVTSDTIMCDQHGVQFLFYINESMSTSDRDQVTKAVREFCLLESSQERARSESSLS